MFKAGDKVKFKEAADAKVTGLDPNGVYTVKQIITKQIITEIKMVQLVGVQGNFYISRFILAEEPAKEPEPKPRDARDNVVRGFHPSDRFAWARANAQMANFQMSPPEMVFNAVIKLEGMKAEDAPRINISGKSKAVKAVLEHLKLVKFHKSQTVSKPADSSCSECTRNADESLECFECYRDFYFGKGKTHFFGKGKGKSEPEAYPYTCDTCKHNDPRPESLEVEPCATCFEHEGKGNWEEEKEPK